MQNMTTFLRISVGAAEDTAVPVVVSTNPTVVYRALLAMLAEATPIKRRPRSPALPNTEAAVQP